MLEVTVKDVGCAIQGDAETCTGILDLTANEAVQLVKGMSMDLESAEFDRLMYQCFKTVTDNPCANCEECNKPD